MSIHLRSWRRRGTTLAVAAGVAALAALTVVPTASAATTGTAAAATSARIAQAGTRVQVPWAKVGPGWELVQYTTRKAGEPAKPAPVTLYLMGPGGARYPLYTWSASAPQPYLVAWSGDKARALLEFPATGKAAQLSLATGKLSTFTMAGQATPLAYTRPSGQNILGWQQVGNTVRLARFSLTGQLLKVLVTGPSSYNPTALYSADGTVLAVPADKGITLISNLGRVIRSLPAGGTSATGCWPVRWWDAHSVLTSCTQQNFAPPRLWLVPLSGAKPTAMTPQRGPSSPDLGDLDAWQLRSGLYLQGATGCGEGQIFGQAANGSITRVTIPGATGFDNRVVTASGSRLLVKAETGCEGSDSLLWINPATHAEQWLLHAPQTEAGVQSVVPYYDRANAS